MAPFSRQLVILPSLALNCGGKTVRLSILTKLTPLPPTRRILGRGRKTLLGNVLSAWPPCNIILNLQVLLIWCVMSAIVPRCALVDLVKTLVRGLSQPRYLLTTAYVVVVIILSLLEWR